MGSAPIYQHPKASQPHPRHKIHPYLLRHLTIEARTQVGWADVTYLPMRRDILWPCRHRPGVCWLRRFIRLPIGERKFLGRVNPAVTDDPDARLPAIQPAYRSG